MSLSVFFIWSLLCIYAASLYVCGHVESLLFTYGPYAGWLMAPPGDWFPRWQRNPPPYLVQLSVLLKHLSLPIPLSLSPSLPLWLSFSRSVLFLWCFRTWCFKRISLVTSAHDRISLILLRLLPALLSSQMARYALITELVLFVCAVVIHVALLICNEGKWKCSINSVLIILRYMPRRAIISLSVNGNYYYCCALSRQNWIFLCAL